MTHKKVKGEIKETSTATPTKQARPDIHNDYHNWKVNPFKPALAHAVEGKLKFLDPQTAVGDTVIPTATLFHRVKSVNASAEKMGKLALIYLDICLTQRGDREEAFTDLRDGQELHSVIDCSP